MFAKATSYHMHLAVFTAGVNIYSSREAKGTASALAVNLGLRDQSYEQFTAEKRTLTATGRCPVHSSIRFFSHLHLMMLYVQRISHAWRAKTGP